MQLNWLGDFVSNITIKKLLQNLHPNKIENLCLESLSKCSPSFWEHYVKHVEDIIDKDWLALMGNY
jgi:hypothetical protein